MRNSPHRCPHCQQLLLDRRAGVRLSSLKAHIFDVIQRAGVDGITIEHINAIVFDGNSTAVNIRTHIGQINDALAETNIRIRGDNPRGFYRIARADVQREMCRRTTRDLSPNQSEPS